MGSEKVKFIRDQKTRQAAMTQLLKDLEALEYMIDNGMIEADQQRIGVEQEMCLIGNDWRPAPVNLQILENINDEHFTTEYARYNLEINQDPQLFTGKCLSVMEKELLEFLEKGEEVAAKCNAHIILVGILPTVHRSHISEDNLTPLQRYKDLTLALKEMRGEHFEFRIEGTDQLITKDENTFFEGSNTSFQVHYQSTAESFIRDYNWALAITAPLMASCTNSPLFLGKRLWRETRIALFEQSIDTRQSGMHYRERSPRVSIGSDWLRNSVVELFHDDISRYPLILAPSRNEDQMALVRQGKAPKLFGLSIFNGTVYKWNRACYGITDGKPHLRIENRVMPSGPTVRDEYANAAFWLGMMKGLPEKYHDIPSKIDFGQIKSNFTQAARQGLGSSFTWMDLKGRISATDLILKELLPISREGLERAGIDARDIDMYLGVIEERVRTGATGSQWLLDSYHKLARVGSKNEALVATTAGLYNRQRKNEPVHTWDLPTLEEAGSWENRFGTIEQIMKTDLVTVGPDDTIEFVLNLMGWKNVRHIPVENAHGELLGIISSKVLIQELSKKRRLDITQNVREIMATDFTYVDPAMSTVEAIALLRSKKTTCLPVVKGEKLVGLVTEYDFVNISAQLLREMPPEE